MGGEPEEGGFLKLIKKRFKEGGRGPLCGEPMRDQRSCPQKQNTFRWWPRFSLWNGRGCGGADKIGDSKTEVKVWLTVVEGMRDTGKNCWADWRQSICNTFYLHPHIGVGFLWVEQRQNGGTEGFFIFLFLRG